MGRNYKVLLAFLFTSSILATSAPVPAADQRLVPRSLYVPVQFSLCEHLDNAVLYEGEQAVAFLPATRIFQFTYYPELERTEPEVVQIRIEVADVAGEEAFKARLAVTPSGIYSGHQAISLDLAKQKKKFRRQIDVRHEKVDLVLQCKRLCSLENERELADGGVRGSGEDP